MTLSVLSLPLPLSNNIQTIFPGNQPRRMGEEGEQEGEWRREKLIKDARLHTTGAQKHNQLVRKRWEPNLFAIAFPLGSPREPLRVYGINDAFSNPLDCLGCQTAEGETK